MREWCNLDAVTVLSYFLNTKFAWKWSQQLIWVTNYRIWFGEPVEESLFKVDVEQFLFTIFLYLRSAYIRRQGGTCTFEPPPGEYHSLGCLLLISLLLLLVLLHQSFLIKNYFGEDFQQELLLVISGFSAWWWFVIINIVTLVAQSSCCRSTGSQTIPLRRFSVT